MDSVESMIKRAGGDHPGLPTDRIVAGAAKKEKRRAERSLMGRSVVVSCVVIFAGLGLLNVVQDSQGATATRSTEVSEGAATYTPELFDSIRNSDIDRLEVLIAQGADVNQRNNSGLLTPLMVASVIDDTEVVQILLDAEADPLTVNQFGETSYEIAARSGSKESFDVLVADLRPSPHLLDQCLLAASRSGNPETLSRILTLGGRTEVVGSEALRLAGTNDEHGTEITGLLIEAGAKP